MLRCGEDKRKPPQVKYQKPGKQSRMNGNWGQGKQNELGNGKRDDDHYP